MERRAKARPVVTDTHRSPITQVITWLLLATMFLGISFRLLTRFFLLRRFRQDDLLIVVSFVFGVVQSVTLLVPEGNIWGMSLEELAPDTLDRGLKAQYAGQLLYILSLCFAKLSVPASLLTISPVKTHRQAIFILGTFVIAWTIISEFLLAFKCGIPQPWNYMTRACLDRQSLALWIGIFNILTDTGLIILPISIIAPLRMPVNKRLTIGALFSARVTVIAATITQLSYLHSSFRSDFTLSSFPYVICTQVVQALSFTTACIPYLQPFLESLKTGLLWTEDIQRQGQTSTVVSSYTNGTCTGNRRDYLEIQENLVTDGRTGSGTELKTLRDKYEVAGLVRKGRDV
ncbi:hypothetical protein N7G274_009728 [Stereocaulon virgatum]|uniref:Rhodopsin domain-containing protein n=1 Tax=Stereocaulon virgatum TaxID=373712 RepID=A0ABR4A291_9LECA